MKTPFRFIRLFLLPFLLFSACATRPEFKPGSISEIPLQERIPPLEAADRLEALTFRIKESHEAMAKYFVLDDEGRILVKTDLSDGIGDFEVVYDLVNADVLGPSAYRVNFSITEKKSGARLDDALVWEPRAGLEGVLLALDDYFIDAWEKHFDLFDKYGAKFTFFVQSAPGTSGQQALDTARFCTAALERGHDIGFHTLNHPDLRTLSVDTFLLEAVFPLESFRAGAIPVSSFAYPFGFSSPWMHRALLRYFGVVRGYGTTYRLYTENQIRGGHIISRAIDNTVIRGDDNFRAAILSMLRTVKFLGKGQVLSLTTHDISGEAAWGISEERLEFLLGTVTELGLKFYRYCDFSPKGD